MPTQDGAPGYLPYLIPLVVMALVILRNARERNLRIERLWITPLMILLLVAASFTHQAPPGPMMLAIDLAALALGAFLGWWRGRLTHITVDPETHSLTSRSSPVGMVVILAIFGLRYGLRAFVAQNAQAMHVSAIEIADVFLILAVGLVCAHRLEIALRATRLLKEARAAS